jgi:hypothetical protein
MESMQTGHYSNTNAPQPPYPPFPPGTNCCNTPGSSVCNTGGPTYKALVETGNYGALFNTPLPAFSDIQTQINSDNPLVVNISGTAYGAHSIIIYGYTNSPQMLCTFDPKPDNVGTFSCVDYDGFPGNLGPNYAGASVDSTFATTS